MKDMNEIARAVTLREGGFVNLSIAQVKEVLRCLRSICRNNDGSWSCVQKYLRYAKRDGLTRKVTKKRAPRQKR